MNEIEIRWAENRVRREAFLASCGMPPPDDGVREPVKVPVPRPPTRAHLSLVPTD